MKLKFKILKMIQEKLIRDIFIAISGSTYDGKKYITQSIKRGAAAIIVDQLINFESDEVTIILAQTNNRKNLPVMLNNRYSNISRQFNMVGVTGTNGKTSITQMLKSALKSIKINSCTLGTIEHSIGEEIIESNNTTPGTIEINEFLIKAHSQGIKTCIMEVSSHGLEQHRVDGLDFDIGVFTNLTSEHLDYHKNMDNYFQAKARLIELSSKGVINRKIRKD
jgi:UDP-N-acetylmuramoyl-L-alanyl-D-glutamate--2,6-diaminopimelate ligase